MTDNGLNHTRRERQIMEIIYERGQASVTEVLEALPDPPSYSAVRAMMNLLKDKGQLKYREEGRKYVYFPALPREKASRAALRSLLQTFFEGSVEQAVASMLDMDEELSDEDLGRLSELIEKARKEGR